MPNVALKVWLVGSQAQAAGVVDMLIRLDEFSGGEGNVAVERVDVADAGFRLSLTAVERLRAERAAVILLVTPEFVEHTAGFGRAMAALVEAATRGNVLVMPVYCRYVCDVDALPWQALSWMPGKLQPLSALPDPDEAVRSVCEQIAGELASFSGSDACRSDRAPLLQETEPDVAVFCAADDDKLVAQDMGCILAVVKRAGAFKQAYTSWQEAPDGDWHERRDRARRAPFVVLMISADFLADDYYWEFISSGLQGHQKVLCVYLRACDYEGILSGGGNRRLVPQERGVAYPIGSAGDKDAAWNQVMAAFRRMLESAS